MLPDYIIFDQLKKERERREQERGGRPRIEIERPLPYWPEPEFEGPEQEEDKADRGVEIIKM